MGAPSDLMNPARRYKWFRPRQAARGFGHITATNHATIGLFNDSTGQYYVVVRDIRVYVVAGAQDVNVAYTQGDIGGTNGTIQPMVPDMQQLAGRIRQLDTTTTYLETYSFVQPNNAAALWQHDFPFAVLPPNWTLVVQAGNNAQTIFVSMVWESILPDELDWFY